MNMFSLSLLDLVEVDQDVDPDVGGIPAVVTEISARGVPGEPGTRYTVTVRTLEGARMQVSQHGVRPIRPTRHSCTRQGSYGHYECLGGGAYIMRQGPDGRYLCRHCGQWLELNDALAIAKAGAA